jgi:hypothetical protein
MIRRATVIPLVAFGALLGCKDSAPPAAALPDAAAPSASTAPSAQPVPRDDEGDRDQVQPVYPYDKQPPLPLAERYCNGVKEAVKKRREECCPNTGAFAMTSECIRTLSIALRTGAVKLDEAELEACLGAVKKETEGCDWMTSVGTPTTPACLGVLKGTLKEAAVCRSNLECEEGLRCRGLTATHPGRCALPLQAGPCNISTDSLASFSGQDDVDRRHPECVGTCVRRQCIGVASNAACVGSYQCGPKGYCVSGKCVEGPPPSVGQPCTDACAPGARCAKGKCVAPKTAAEACEEDAECRGRCVREDAGKLGHCVSECPSFPRPPKRP